MSSVRKSLALGGPMLSAMTAAVSFGIVEPEGVLNLVQTGQYNMWGSDSNNSGCCCHFMPCMPTCMTQCESKPSPPLPPVFKPEDVPPAVGDVILNLDVILTHILHEIEPAIPPEIPVPPPSEPKVEMDFVQSVLTPVVIQLMANDIAPQLPVCTYPNGQSFYLQKPGHNAQSSVPDMNELLTGSLEGIMDTLSTHEGMNDHTRQLLENLDPSQIISDLMVKDDSGEHAVEVIVAGQKTHASNVTGELVHSTTGGRDQSLEDQIGDIVRDLTDKANE